MKNRTFAMGVIILALLTPLVISSDYYLHLLILSGIYVMLAQGLNLILGYVGQLSLGHQAFLGIGSYASGLMALRLGMPFWQTLLFSGLICALFSFLIGLVTLRLRSSYFVVVTISFAEIIRIIILNSKDLTGGPMGLGGIPSPNIFGYQFNSKASMYYLVLVLALISIYICYRMVNSNIGRSFVAIRENEELAESIGISAFKYAMIATVTAGFLAGLAGSLYAHYVTFVSTDLITFNYIVTMLLMVVIGGKGTITGPIVGAVLFTFIPEFLRMVNEYRMPIYGLTLVLAVLLMPKGITPVISKLISKMFKGRTKQEVNHALKGGSR